MVTSEDFNLVLGKPDFYRAPRKPAIVDLPDASFLVIDGEGAPDGPVFQAAIQALYGIAYGVKMDLKKRGMNFKVPPFGGSWWIGDPGQELPREQWKWQLSMMMPDYVTEGDVTIARLMLAARRGIPEPAVHLKKLTFGLCVQAMHFGPYDTEMETIDAMEKLMQEHHLRRRGPHHEVYLGDPRRTKPERLKTLLRIPVEADNDH
jgi:hypothetical protein